ncbi:MAG: rhodanese-like domain-containing protein [Pseudomonadota bacterium]
MGHAGDVTAREAWAILQGAPAAQLVDVRSEAEWAFVGVPDLRSLGKEPVLIAWQSYPGMRRNPDFLTALIGRCADKTAPLLFLCRSGGRSAEAAAAVTAAGYERCYNVTGGFEGARDETGHRATVSGWKVAALPWVQS